MNKKLNQKKRETDHNETEAARKFTDLSVANQLLVKEMETNHGGVELAKKSKQSLFLCGY